MAWQRRRACEVDWTFQTEEREGSFCKGSESWQCVFLLGSHEEVSFTRVQGPERWGARGERQGRVGVSTNGECRLDSSCGYCSEQIRGRATLSLLPSSAFTPAPFPEGCAALGTTAGSRGPTTRPGSHALSGFSFLWIS